MVQFADNFTSTFILENASNGKQGLLLLGFSVLQQHLKHCWKLSKLSISFIGTLEIVHFLSFMHLRRV